MPTLSLALPAFAAGATVLQWQPVLPAMTAWCASGVAAAAAALIVRWLARRHRVASAAARTLCMVATLLTVVASGALGFGYAAWRAEMRLAQQLPPAWEGVDVALVGIVDELPQASPRGTRFAFAVERIETAGAMVPARISLAWYAQLGKAGAGEPPLQLAAGERWRLVVRLKRPHGNVNPHGFDIEAWLLENNLRATGYVRNDDRNARLQTFAGRPSDWVARARERVRARILAALPDADYAGVIVALTIGDQRAITDGSQRTRLEMTGR